MELIEQIRACQLCKAHLPHGTRPVVQLSTSSKIVIVGQAPGRKVHETGIPWNDASGRTLRRWLNVDADIFYNPDYFSIVPMGFCYPGKGKSGDLPPRSECASTWHSDVFKQFKQQPLMVLVGQYAQRYYLGKRFLGSLTETMKHYQDFLPAYFPLPHPSPRNQNWIKVNPWFTEEVILQLQLLVHATMKH